MFHVLSLVRNLLRRDHVERDLDDEVRAILELLVEEQVRAGVSEPHGSPCGNRPTRWSGSPHRSSA